MGKTLSVRVPRRVAAIVAVVVAVAVPVLVITVRSFNEVINVGSLQHLREIQCHAIKYHPGLSVGIDVFVASSADGRCAGHQLRDHENNDRKDKHRHE